MLYTGNEGPVDAFWEGNGFMQGLAAKWGGLIVFPEEVRLDEERSDE